MMTTPNTTPTVVVIVITAVAMASNEHIQPFPDDLSMFDFKSNFKRHPFLYFDAENIPGLQLAAKSSHRFLANDIKKATETILQSDRLPHRDYKHFAAKWNEKYGNDLPVLSMYCVLNKEDKKVFEYLVEYMDRLAVFQKWQTTTALEDEVPVSHILIGFVTAFDFLHPRFDRPRQLKYARQIVNKTEELYEMSKKKWWGKVYLQNHVFTNVVALLTASLVIEPYDQRGTVWKKHAVKLLERNMYLLGYITDGSITESDHYHSYSTRSITQYVFLCKRHMGVDHTSHVWLSNAFWYYYGTALPGMEEPVGFADYHPGWTYGYEANLFFIDRFVLQTGNANWLAMKIRQHNKKRSNFASSDTILSMHLDYIWYDPSLKPVAPSTEGLPTLYTYPDMGVVTFRTSTELIPNNTFLSFKSGKLHGASINKLVNDNPKWLRGWNSFNPGHEQPDRNSFTFAPHGVPMISEGVKNYKYTYLDNTLMFKLSEGNANIESCKEGWVGQIGECSKYLKYGKRNPSGLAIDAEIVTSTFKDNVVHVAGEAKGAYHPSLKLESFYRNALLITPEVLVVVDHIQIGQTSPIQYISSFFNNRYFGFSETEDSFGKQIIALDQLEYNNYRMFWALDDSSTSNVNITNNFTSAMLDHSLNNINITFKMGSIYKRIAYILYGPNSSVQELSFTVSSMNGVTLKLVVNREIFNISLPTNYRDSLSRQHFLNHEGFYSLQRSSLLEESGNIPNGYMEKSNVLNKAIHNDINSDTNSIDSSIFEILNLTNKNEGRNIKDLTEHLNTPLQKYDYPYRPSRFRAHLQPRKLTTSSQFTDTSLIFKFIAITFVCSAACYLWMTKKIFVVIKSFPVPVRYISFSIILGAILFILMY